MRRTTPSQRVLGASFIAAGTNHFVMPRAYEAIMPPYLPYHRAAVAISGAAEIVGGAGMLAPPLRGFARWWLIALLVAVFPANLYMATNPHDVKGLDLNRIPRWTLWARLPLQLVLIRWVWRATD